ncbi:uncharacterized protein LOC132262124 [Phlebotomus argentipes]|uniref:uncharacterized protein LOC132262124 n=1 Tax=Phlebotomus argentipes TaxID=94469 RepID=UPI0028936899|nr:uncharacterized protein LOC132262124 [Phlebotomus argentipes]
MSNTDRLVSIPPEDLLTLLDMYKVNWPRHLLSYQTIYHFFLWLQKNSSIEDLFVWSLNGSWRQNGTVIIKSHRDIHIATLDETHESLFRALCLLDWSPGILVCSFLEYMRPAPLRAIEKCRVPVAYDCSYKFFILAKEKAMDLQEVNLPENITIKRLAVEDASVANDLWPYKKDGSLVFLERMAKYNVAFSAYSSTGQLVGWVFVDSSLGIGTLHVVDEFRGRKIAQALVVKMCHYLSGTLNIDPHTFIVTNNYPSINLFKKLGFVENTELGYWIQTKPFSENGAKLCA